MTRRAKTKSLGAIIKCRRESLGQSTRQLAKESGVTAAYIVEIEKGRRNPRADKRAAIGRALGMAAGELEDTEHDEVLAGCEWTRLVKENPLEMAVLLSFVPVGQLREPKRLAARQVTSLLQQDFGGPEDGNDEAIPEPTARALHRLEGLRRLLIRCVLDLQQAGSSERKERDLYRRGLKLLAGMKIDRGASPKRRRKVLGIWRAGLTELADGIEEWLS